MIRVNLDAAHCRPSLGVSILVAEGSIEAHAQPALTIIPEGRPCQQSRPRPAGRSCGRSPLGDTTLGGRRVQSAPPSEPKMFWSIRASLLRLGMPAWLALNIGTCTPSIGPTCARRSSHSPRCSDASRSMLPAQRVERGRTDTRTLRSLVEVCGLVEVARDLCHPAPASSRSQKHIAVGLCLGGSREGFALLGQQYPIFTIVHPCRLMASRQLPSGPICDRVSSSIAKCGESSPRDGHHIRR